VGLHLVDLSAIDDVRQTLSGDLAVRLGWTDPRLTHLEGQTVPIEDIWSPGISFVNSGRVFADRPDRATIGSDGRVTYIQRYQATLATYHDLADFPFDEQRFVISLRSLEWPEDDVVLLLDEAATGRRERLNISDWRVLSTQAEIASEYGRAFDARFQRYDFCIAARRMMVYYVWKVMLPLFLIVTMSWAVFWIPPEASGTQIGVAATSMLTLIAFIFATTNMVPKLGYFTRLDKFIVGATFFVFLALLESVLTSVLVSRGFTHRARRVDALCRVVFPLAFVLFGLLAFAG
jgi:hypothetical protein